MAGSLAPARRSRGPSPDLRLGSVGESHFGVSHNDVQQDGRVIRASHHANRRWAGSQIALRLSPYTPDMLCTRHGPARWQRRGRRCDSRSQPFGVSARFYAEPKWGTSVSPSRRSRDAPVVPRRRQKPLLRADASGADWGPVARWLPNRSMETARAWAHFSGWTAWVWPELVTSRRFCG